MRPLALRIVREECAQGLIEYALLASSISLIAIGAILSVGEGIGALWDAVVAKMPEPETGF